MGDRGVRIGIAGWSYPDWQGIVYPRNCRDALRHVAKLVDFIEINSSFYHAPSAERAASWLRRTADLELDFTAKLPRASTHQGQLGRELVGEYCRGLEPLADAGRLPMLLAQFSYRFEATRENLIFLRELEAAYAPLAPLALEVRHRSWSDPEAQARVAEYGFSLVHLDYPGAGQGFDGSATAIFGAEVCAYMRLHGRNHQAWFDQKAGRDATYDYEYRRAEVAELQRRISRLAEQATVTRVVANNHFHGKAMKLVLELIAWHSGAKVDVSDGMLGRFPDLKTIAVRSQGELF